MREWLKANGGPPAVVIVGVFVAFGYVPVGIGIGMVGLLMWLYKWDAVSDRLPTVALERHAPGGGLAIRIRPPAGPKDRRLKQEIETLCRDMFEELRNRPAPYIDSIKEHHETTSRMMAATTEEEKTTIWNELTYSLIERSSKESQELQELFGGRVTYVVQELDSRGLLRPESTPSRIEWYCHSWHWLGSAAQELQAAAKRL